MEKEDQRNFLIAMVLMVAFIWAYQTFVIDPETRARTAAREAAQAEQAIEQGTTLQVDAHTPPAVAAAATVKEALAADVRIPFDGPGVDGSIRVAGARIDDLSLKRHHLTVARKEELRLLRPENAEYGYYAAYGWRPEGGAPVVGPNTPWQIIDGSVLTPSSPVTLAFEREGLRFTRRILLDENYMFSFEDTVENTGAQAVTLSPFGVVRRFGPWKEFLEATDPGSAQDSQIVHQGLIGVVDGELKLRKYNKLMESLIGTGIKGSAAGKESAQGGWIGLTDKYWMGALVPQQDRAFVASAGIEATANSGPLSGRPLAVTITGEAFDLAPGERITAVNRIFAGAKELRVLNAYQDELGVPRFDDAVDWGFLYFLTKPFFTVLSWLEGKLGNFGWAILAFTVLVKIPLIPLYNTSFKAMAKMKKLTEPMKEIRERFAADPKRQQQEIMKLYQREKANPITGCLPILATMPIFYALYKTLFVTLEMRHVPFGYISDLSAPDPTAIGNLFGLLPWAASDVKAIPILGFIIGIGILPLLYGITMAALQSLNPPPPDPTQRTVIMLLPLIFTFVFASFSAGLVIYWVWNNVLMLIQQYYIMRRNGAETEIGKFIAKRLGQNKSEAG